MGAIQSRRGAYADFDPNKQASGEFATVLSGDPAVEDGRAVYQSFGSGIVKRLCTYQEVSGLVDLAEGYAELAETSAGAATTQASNASDSATLSESWAVGGTDSRTGEDTDNSKFYAKQSQEYKEFVENAVNLNVPVFSVDFTTGLLMYEGGMFDFLVNYETGNLDWEVG